VIFVYIQAINSSAMCLSTYELSVFYTHLRDKKTCAIFVFTITVCCLSIFVFFHWCCLLSSRKGIRPVKKLSVEVLASLSVWLEVQICIWPSWCHCHPMSLASVKSRSVLVTAHPGNPEHSPEGHKRMYVCVCECVCLNISNHTLHMFSLYLNCSIFATISNLAF